MLAPGYPEPSAWVRSPRRQPFPLERPAPAPAHRLSSESSARRGLEATGRGAWVLGSQSPQAPQGTGPCFPELRPLCPFHPDPEPCLRRGRAFWGQRGKEETRIPSADLVGGCSSQTDHSAQGHMSSKGTLQRYLSWGPRKFCWSQSAACHPVWGRDLQDTEQPGKCPAERPRVSLYPVGGDTGMWDVGCGTRM